MQLKTDAPQFDLTIDTEESLDNCIKLLESSENLRSCILHFTINDLPPQKITRLADMLKIQTKLDTLALTADLSLDSSEQYASILENVFTDLSHLRSLIFRGLFSENTVKTLVNLIQTTKTLSILSVGACYEGQDCKVISEKKSGKLARALRKNATLTHLDFSRNALHDSGVGTIIHNLIVGTIIHNLSATPTLKILNLSDNIYYGNKGNYRGRGILELFDKHNALEEIHADGIEITPLKMVFSCTNYNQIELMHNYLARVSTVRHLELSFSAFGNIERLALTINNLPYLQKLELQDITSQVFQILCQQSLIKPSALTDLAVMDVSTVTNEKETALSLIALIQGNTHLTSLTFCPKYRRAGDWISNELAVELGKALEQNRNLIHFELKHTKLKNPEIIAGIIVNNSCLQDLNLENNDLPFDAEGVGSILGSLSKNKTLLTLNLCFNQLKFPQTLNSKFNLIDFQILKFPAALEDKERLLERYGAAILLENKIQPKIYRLITEAAEDNKKWRMIQKYLLLMQIGQSHSLNKDVINFIFLHTLGSFELQTLGETIRKSKEVLPDQIMPESVPHPLELTIDTEESLDNCIKLLESSENLRSCTLHFTINDLPPQKITRLADLLKIQTKLDTLALTADLSLDSSKHYASILENIFTELSLLRSLTFRGLFSDNLPSGIDKTNYSGRPILELLGEHKALKEIRVDGIEITPNKFVYSFSRAERLDLACKYLSKVLTVRHLELSLPALGSTADQYQLLALTINNLPHLQELKLSGLSSQGFQILCQQSLIKPSALTDLTLTGVSNLTEESALNLIALIKSNTHLTSLTFCPGFGADKSWIGNELGAELGKALGQNQNLTYFKLNRTKLNDPEIIAGIIANNTSLQVLNLENNGFCFDESGVESILNSLNYNKTLSTLNLCSNLLTFPIILNPKFHLINFQILNDTTALEDYPGAQRNNSDFPLENKIQPEIYHLITDRVEENKKWRIIQKYLLLQHLGTQTYPLNTDLINLIFLCTLGRFELQAMAYRIENSKKISIDRNLIEPTLSTIENIPSDEHVEQHVMDEKKLKKIPFDKQILLSPEQISAMKIDEDGFSADYPDSYFDFVYQECLSKQYSIIRCKKEEASNFRPVEFPYHTQILISSERFNALKRDEDGFSTVYPDSYFDHIYQEVESQKQAIIHYKKEYALPEIMSRKREKEKWKKGLEQRRKEFANIPQRPVQERFEEALKHHQLQKIEIKTGAFEVMILENATEQPAESNKTSVASQPLPPQKVVNPSSKITKKPNQEMDIALANLKKHIDELGQHGRTLTAFSFDKNKGTYDPYSKEFIKGTHIATLVHDLNSALKIFNKSMTKASFKTLSERFTKALNENQDELQTHRDEWVPFAVFAGNILIGLSIIGALFFAGKAIYASTTREGLSLHSVFVGMRTASEKKALEIESDLEPIALRL